ncbi:hypothetical protein ACQ4PT_026086 [Festuca glaucescens]
MPPTIAESEAAAHLSSPPPVVAGGGNVACEAAIDVSSSDTEPDSGGAKRPRRRRRVGREEKRARVLDAVPPGFLEPLPPRRCVTKQFWKAGDYDGKGQLLWSDHSRHSESGMEHVRVHPRFLHSNATSHKWALGAFAELLDNSLDEVSNGATFVNIDMLENKKDGSRMLLVQDDGGGMSPDKIRHCMSLGYSVKSKVKNTIGQYGNGFKTSTMRLGADVLFNSISEQGTRIIIYNLWEDEQGDLELDFGADVNMVANVIIGFVKDAKHHVPIQGFNVYHRNRLIKPFWRVWTLPGSQGRGIIGVLEVNFVEPAHDKQDFERTNSLSRLEARLVLMQKKYWSENCHRIGYGGNHANRSSGKRDRDNHLSFHALSTFQEGTVKNNGHGGTIDDPESVIKQLKDENSSLKERFSKVEELLSKELQTEREKNKSLLEKMENLEAKLETAKKEQEALVDAYAEEMKCREQEEQNLRNKLKEASSTIQYLTEQLNAARSYRKS